MSILFWPLFELVVFFRQLGVLLKIGFSLNQTTITEFNIFCVSISVIKQGTKIDLQVRVYTPSFLFVPIKKIQVNLKKRRLNGFLQTKPFVFGEDQHLDLSHLNSFSIS